MRFTALRDGGHEWIDADSIDAFVESLEKWTRQSRLVYTAWAPGMHTWNSLGASIAAGRTLTLSDGVYTVGVPVEDKPSDFQARVDQIIAAKQAEVAKPAEPSKTPTLDKLEAEKDRWQTVGEMAAAWQGEVERACGVILHRAVITDPNAAMQARDNRDRTQAETDFRIRQLAAQLEATAKAEASRAPK